MVPRLVSSPCSRARNLRRVGLSWPRSSDSAATGWVSWRKGGELGQVYAVLPVVVLRVAAYPAGAVVGRPLGNRAPLWRVAGRARQSRADEASPSPFSLVSVVTLCLASHRDGDFLHFSRLNFLNGVADCFRSP